MRQVAMATALLLCAAVARSTGADAPSATASATQAAVNDNNFFSPLPEKTQEDLGDIRPEASAPFSSYFQGEAEINTQYVSNAPLYHSHDDADFLTAPMLEEGFAAPLNKYFRLDIETRVEDYTYASHQTLGFWGFSADGSIEFRYKPSWPRFYVGTDPYYYFTYSRATGSRAPSGRWPGSIRRCRSIAGRRWCC